MKDWVKYLMLFLAVDSIVNVIISLSQKNPLPVSVVSTVMRILTFLFLMPTVLNIIYFFQREQNLKTFDLLLTHIIIYFLIPIALYFLRDASDSPIKIFIDLHKNSFLFISIYFSYLISSTITLYLSYKLKLL